MRSLGATQFAVLVAVSLLLFLEPSNGQRSIVSFGSILKKKTASAVRNRIKVDSIVEDDIVVEGDHVVAKAGLESIDLAFEGLKVELTTKKGTKKILDGSIRGRARPGRMLAILGPSGAGKSSVLHALAGRVKESKAIKVYGSRYINGVPLSGDSLIPSAFIEQDVDFFPYMTVRETLSFRVELKLGSMLSKTSRDTIVWELMAQMGLTKSADTIVGNGKVRGISGGERKRLSIAVELISSPAVIFLDEPTSGLDSTAATVLIQKLRDLADAGKTVIAVIHQPNQHVFAKFDDILLVSEGKQMYFGERKNVRSFMETYGCRAPSEMGTAEHILDCITRTPLEVETMDQANKRMDTLASMAKTADIDLGLAVSKSSDGSSSVEKGFRKFLAAQHGPRANILVQFRLLFKRAIKEVARGKTAIILKLVQQVTTALVYGGIYSIGTNQASIIDRFGLLSLMIIGTTNLAVAQTIRAFPREKTIVSKELATRMYRTLPYFVAKAISEVPVSGFLNSLFGVLVYKLTGLSKDAMKFRRFLGLLMFQGIVSEAAGLLIGAVSPNSDVALAIFPAVIVLSIIFDGKNISEENTPKALRWVSKLGLIRWGFEGLCINEFTGLEFDTSGPMRGPVAKTGQDALERFGLGSRSIQDILKAQACVVTGSWALSFIGLSLSKQKFEVMQPPSTSN